MALQENLESGILIPQALFFFVQGGFGYLASFVLK
jgi:hypothetical protein